MKVFMIMPFKNELSDSIYNHCTKKICEEYGLKCERADEIITTNPIIEDIVKAIEEATIVIADISEKNANVFYELGMAHMIKQNQTIIITQDDFKSVPFDIHHFRIINYEDSIVGKDNYEHDLRSMIKNILRDYKLIYRNEFDMLIRFKISENNTNEIYSIMALDLSPEPIKRSEHFHIEGHNTQIKDRCGMISLSIEDNLTLMFSLQYAKIAGEYISITEKGKSFVDYLQENGFVLDAVNEHVLTEGYKPSWNWDKGNKKYSFSERKKEAKKKK